MRKQCKFKMTKNNMQNIFYAIIMTKAKVVGSHGIGIYEYNKRINSRHSVDIMLEIEEENINEFKILSGYDLNEPIKIKCN